MNLFTIILILALAAYVIIRISKARAKVAKQKYYQAKMEQDMGRLKYIMQQKTKYEQELKLTSVLFVLGGLLLAGGIIFSASGWYGGGIAQMFLFGIVSIMAAIAAKVGIPKKIAEIENEIKYLQEVEK